MIKDINEIKNFLAVTCPFLFSLVAKVRIFSSDCQTACVTEKGELHVSEKFWKDLNWQERVWVIAHEVFHIAFRDIKRMSTRDRDAWNTVCDAVNNYLLNDIIITPYSFSDKIITLERIADSIPSANTMNKEQLYELLKQELDRRAFGSSENERDGSDKTREAEGSVDDIRDSSRISRDMVKQMTGKMIQEGDPELYDENGEKDDADEKWKDNIIVANEMQRSSGRIPAGVQRIIDSILNSKVDWRTLLRKYLREGLGRRVISTWKRPSRRLPEVAPGIKRFSTNIWCLIDVSGSIDNRELNTFMSEVLKIASNFEVYAVFWDDDVEKVVKVKREQPVKNIKGCGGTVISPVLNYTLKHMHSGDSVIIFSDMEISDINSKETLKLFDRVSRKSSVSIIFTESSKKVKGWKVIRASL